MLAFAVADLSTAVQAALQHGAVLDGPISYRYFGKAAVLRSPEGTMVIGIVVAVCCCSGGGDDDNDRYAGNVTPLEDPYCFALQLALYEADDEYDAVEKTIREGSL